MNILLVDDDNLFIRKTVEKMEWDEIGVRRVFSAEDMQQALQILNDFSIDIMITDIEMPRGNGLELLEKVTRNYKSVDTLVISGYAHFSFAQKAMEFGAKRFLLKPVSNNELRRALEEIIVDRKNKESDNRKYLKNTQIEKFDVVEGKTDVVSELKKMASKCSKDEYFCEIIFQIMHQDAKSETEKKLLICMINNVIMEFLSESYFPSAKLYQINEEKWSIVIRKNSKEDSVISELTNVQKYLEETLKLQSCFYVGKTGLIEEIINNYPYFEHFCDELIFCEQSILLQEEIEKNENIQMTSIDFEQIGLKFKEGDISSVKDEIIEYIKCLKKEHKASLKVFRELLKNVNDLIMLFLERHNMELLQIFDEEEYENKQKKSLESTLGMQEYVSYTMGRLEGIKDQGNGKKQLVETLKEYILNHLNEDLTRSKLARIINFSEDYVARFFRAETGKTISEYVMEQRMEKAKYYLDETQMSIGDISFEVGYNNFSYFSKTFKMYTGKTPNEYRARKK